MPSSRQPLSYANVMSTLAVFIALGGTSYAVARNSIGTRELKDGAVTSRKIRDHAVARVDLAPGALPAGPRGPRGAQGPAGPIGPSTVVETQADAPVTISSTAGSSETPAKLTLDAGSWLLEGQTTVIFQPSSPGSEWYDCRLLLPDGTVLGMGTVRVGNDALGTAAGVISARAAATFPSPTQVSFACSHPSTVATPDATARHTTLTATQAGAVDMR